MEIWIKVKRTGPGWVILVMLLLVAGLMTSCSPDAQVTRETDERAYRRGESLLREGRREEALQAFLSVISTRPDAIESHLEAGLIYLNHIKDPLAAIYHFRSYLAFNPEGEHAEYVSELILTAQKDFAQSLPGNPFRDTVDRVNLMETVKDLQKENTGLKETILELRRQLEEQERDLLGYREALSRARETGTGPSTEVAPIIIEPAPAGAGQPAESGRPATYVVQAGDTLSRISAKVYGTSGRWMDIFQANRDQLPSPNALQPGQELRIP